MHAHTTGRARLHGTAGTAARWAAVLAAAAALAACGTPRVAAATPGGSAPGQRTLTYYAFDINNGPTDPGFIPAPGTNPKVFSQGDELIINDQLTTTRQVNGGYPIVGHDAGVCTLTRIPQQHVPQQHANQTLANCVVTAVWNNGSLTVQGVVPFTSQQPGPAVFAVTGGTGRFEGAAGTLGVSFTKNFKILTIKLK
jgi:Dirigent-like protein